MDGEALQLLHGHLGVTPAKEVHEAVLDGASRPGREHLKVGDLTVAVEGGSQIFACGRRRQAANEDGGVAVVGDVAIVVAAAATAAAADTAAAAADDRRVCVALGQHAVGDMGRVNPKARPPLPGGAAVLVSAVAVGEIGALPGRVAELLVQLVHHGRPRVGVDRQGGVLAPEHAGPAPGRQAHEPLHAPGVLLGEQVGQEGPAGHGDPPGLAADLLGVDVHEEGLVLPVVPPEPLDVLGGDLLAARVGHHHAVAGWVGHVQVHCVPGPPARVAAGADCIVVGQEDLGGLSQPGVGCWIRHETLTVAESGAWGGLDRLVLGV